MDFELDNTPPPLTTPVSPRQPASKRPKEDTPTKVVDEESTYEQSLLNNLGWVIHTLTIENEKRKTAKTAYKHIDDSLTKLHAMSKVVRKSLSHNSLKKNTYEELIDGFVNKYTTIFAEKEATISEPRSQLQKPSNPNSTIPRPMTNFDKDIIPAPPSFAQAVSRGRSNTRNLQKDRFKSRVSRNKSRSEVAKAVSPPPAIYLNTGDNPNSQSLDHRCQEISHTDYECYHHQKWQNSNKATQ